MALAKITIAGLNAYSKGSVFDNFYLPEDSKLDRQLAIDEIIMSCGDFPLLYPDMDYMKNEIGDFSKKWELSISRWAKAINVEYNPLYNVDVTTEVIDKTENWADSNAGSTSKTSAFNSEDFQNKDKIDSNGHTEGEVTFKHTEVKQGNQGVTMSGQMLRDEYISHDWNIYEKIASLFKKEFCIPVYV